MTVLLGLTQCRSVSPVRNTGIILFQSLFRRMSAMKKTEVLRQNRLHANATVIQAKWRGHTSMIRFTWKMYDIILVQSLARRWISSRRADELGQRRNQIDIAAATKIQSHWRSFYKYTEYMITLGGLSTRLCAIFICLV